MGKRGPQKGEGGRPRKVVNWKAVDKLCQLNSPAKEISAYLSITGEDYSYDTLDRRCKEDHGLTFAKYVREKTMALSNVSLRRAQFQGAVDDRNPTLLIWLGKQYLGQMDTQYMRHSGPDGGPIVHTYLPENNRADKPPPKDEKADAD